MTNLDTLKAKLMASNTLAESLTWTAKSSDQVAESLDDTAVSGEVLASAMDDVEGESISLSRALGAANSELGEGAAKGAIYADGMDEVAQEQAEAAASAALIERQLDAVGDEAVEGAAKAQVFGESVDDAADPDVRATFGGISGSIKRIGAAAAAASVPLAGLAAGLGGVAAFGGAGGLAAGAFTAGGIQGAAEEAARMNSNLEDAAEAREQLLGNFKSELADAFEPLQGQASQQFAMENLAALVTIAEDAGDSLASVQDTVFDVATGLREAAVATSPEIFDELATQTERLAPLFEQLDGVIRDIPAFISYLGDVTARIGPDLFTLGASAVDVGAGFVSMGVAVSDVLLPPLNASLFVLGGLMGLFQALPGPVQNAAAAFVVMTGAAFLLSGGLGVLSAASTIATGALATLTTTVAIFGGIVTAPLWAILALGAAVVGLASYFGVLDDAANIVVGTWNSIVEWIEFSINAILGVTKAIGNFLGPLGILLGPLGAVIYLISHWNKVMGIAGDVVDWLGSKIEWIAKQADKYLGPVIDALDGVADGVDKAGGVELDAAKVGDDEGSNDGGGNDRGPTGRGGGPGTQPPAAPRGGTTAASRQPVDRSRNSYDVTVNSQGEDPEAIADRVVEKLDKESQRQTGHQ